MKAKIKLVDIEYLGTLSTGTGEGGHWFEFECGYEVSLFVRDFFTLSELDEGIRAHGITILEKQ